MNLNAIYLRDYVARKIEVKNEPGWVIGDDPHAANSNGWEGI